MSNETLLDDLQDLNISYLLLAQRLINADRPAAMLRLKLAPSMADFLGALGSRQIVQLAKSGQLAFRPVLDDASALDRIIERPLDDDMARLHAALLLAGAPIASSAIDVGR